jgi:lambda repressor-like predicted transcriptional regulator
MNERERTWIDELPDVIADEIKAQGLKLRHVSQQAGFPHDNYLAKMMGGDKKLNMRELSAIAQVIQVSEEELIIRAKKTAHKINSS